MPSFVASREKIKHSGRKIAAKCCRMTSNKYVESNFSPSCPFIYKISLNLFDTLLIGFKIGQTYRLI